MHRTEGRGGPIEVVEAGAIRRITLNRPDKLNALNSELLDALAAALREADADPGVKVVLLAGAGRVFSAGADLKEFEGLPAQDQTERIRIRSTLAREVARLLATIHPITIAVVQERVIGGALVLMIACDLRIAAEGTRLHLPEIEFGAPLGWGGVPRLIREIGPARTRELILLGGAVDAPEAVAIGLLNRHVPSIDLEREVDTVAQALAERTSLALTGTKRHVAAVLDEICDPQRSFADDDVLVLSTLDPGTAAARASYTERSVGDS